MSELDLVLRGGTVVAPDHDSSRLDIGIAGGRIAVLASPGTRLRTLAERDISGLHVFPGVIDPHTHLGVGGGMTEYTTDTAAAALGGVTTVFSILIHPGAYEDEVVAHMRAADAAARTDFGFHVTLMTDDHAAEVPRLVDRHGITSFKYYMSFRGDEGTYLGVAGTDDGAFLGILNAVASCGGVLAIHPENIEVIWRLRGELRTRGEEGLRAWHKSRPPFAEAEAVLRAAYLAGHAGCSVYFVHLSGAEPVSAVDGARRLLGHAGIFAETCPHFLTHDHQQDLGSLGKVNPPLREPSDRDALWTALADGTVDALGSDHVGRRREQKKGSIWTASAGFPGVSTILPVLLSEGYHKGRLSLAQIARLTASRPAEIFGINDRKGSVRLGADADLAIVDLDWQRTPTADLLGTWCDYSLYENTALRGWPRMTLLRGKLIQENGTVVAEPGVGEYLRRCAH